MPLKPVKEVDSISAEEFRREHLQACQPLVIRGALSRQWPAYEKWTPEYLKAAIGELEVPLFDNHNVGLEPMCPVRLMKFCEYIDFIAKGPTELHLFALNIYKHAPALLQDFRYPQHLLQGFVKKVPTLFVGGAGAVVHLHYDFDFPNLIHTQFHGRKRAVLFEQSKSSKLYKLPFTVQSPVDLGQPDLSKYPAVEDLSGLVAVMEHGDTLFIPSGWWHHMEYLDAGYALTLRARSPYAHLQMRAIYNAACMFGFDVWMRRVTGPRWFRWQEKVAIRRASRQQAPGRRNCRTR